MKDLTLMTQNAVARYLGISKQTIINWERGWYYRDGEKAYRDTGFPHPVKFGANRKVYRRDEIDAWYSKFVSGGANA